MEPIKPTYREGKATLINEYSKCNFITYYKFNNLAGITCFKAMYGGLKHLSRVRA